jgi:hypothetical protein
MARHALPWIVLLAAALHLIGMSRAPLPAQDGLKFLRIARQFHHQPWIDVVRGADQHPLYPALIALAQPPVAAAIGPGPDSWRIAAQAVSSLASLALLAPLFGLTRLAFDEATATLAVLLYVLLPLPAEVGHDTLADALALLGFALALWFGALALRSEGLAAPIGCGLAAGVGYLARPEVLLVPIAVGITALVRLVLPWARPILLPLRLREADWSVGFGDRAETLRPGGAGVCSLGRKPQENHGDTQFSGAPEGQCRGAEDAMAPTAHRPSGAQRPGQRPRSLGLSPQATLPRPSGAKQFLSLPGIGDHVEFRPASRFSVMAVSALVIVGAYALAKGEVSEKLALRHAAGIGSRSTPIPRTPHWLPPGLDDPQWDFSPKEESDHPAHLGFVIALRRLLGGWAGGLGWVLAPLAVWGAWRTPMSARGDAVRRLTAVYLLLFGAVLIRHAMALGYLSGRHVLTMVLVALPWAAAGLRALVRRLVARFGRERTRVRRIGWCCTAVAILMGTMLQAKPGHPSRWGHLAAGRWLAEHAGKADAVLDTRGWAAFASDRTSYDYWHVRQALTDARLAYLVVGTDELTAPSRRAATLRAVLAFAATPVAAFPERRGGRDIGVRVYRYRRPGTWEGLRP